MIAGLNASSTFPRLHVQILKGGLFTCPEFSSQVRAPESSLPAENLLFIPFQKLPKQLS